jgi:hypothetical protein
MRRSSLAVHVVLLVVSIVALTALVQAQYGASLQGTVTDQSGAVVAGATVTITNQATGVTQTTATSGSGFYRVPALLPGQYTVDVESTGFRKSHFENVQVDAESARGLDVALVPGGSQETVSVTSDVSGVQSETATIAGGLTAKQIEELPQFGRDPYELLRLAPGVFGDGARNATGQAQLLPNGAGPGGSNNSIYQVENQVQVTANGQRNSGNNFLIDGVDVNSLTWGGASVVTPNQESIAEVKIISTSYSAEDGRNSGAQVKVVSKSGSNQFHGSAFFKYGEPGLNAFNKFNGFINGFDPAPTVRVSNKSRNYGGSIGGPIVKDKLFFFFSIEGQHNNLSDLNVGYVETPEFRQALLAARPGSVAAQLLSEPGVAPQVKKFFGGSCGDIVAFDPVNNPGICSVIPAGAGTQGGLDLGSPVPITDPTDPYVPLSLAPSTIGSSFIGNGLDGIPDVVQAQLVNPSHHYGMQYNGRVDYQRGNHLLAASTYITKADNLTTTNDQFRAMGGVLNQPTNPAGTLLWNWTASPTLLNEARLNFSRFNFDEVSTNHTVNFGIPEIQVEGIFNTGPRLDFGVKRGNNTPGVLSQNTYAFRDTVSKVIGRHALKFGFEARKEQNNNNEIGLARPVYSNVRLWNFFNSAPIFEGVDINPQNGLPDPTQRYLRTSDYALFGQTDWKVRPNLTLNLGLRWEYYTPLSEKQGKLTQLDQGPIGSPNPIIHVVSQLYPSDRNNFAPRIGFAWSPEKFNSKLVWRGGVGLFYNRFEGSAFGPMRENPPFHAAFGFCCGTSRQDFSTPFLDGIILYELGTSNSPLSFPVNPKLAVGVDPVTNFPLSCQSLPVGCNVQVYSTPHDMPNPYTYVYSLEMEYQLAPRMTLTLGYAGSIGRKQIRIYDLNQVRDDLSLQHLVNPNFFIQPDVNSNFNSLNARFAKTFARGFQFDAKYRWSKSLDQSSFGAPNAAANETFPRDLRTEYGPSDYDASHNFVANGIWELPIFRGRHDLIGRALGGWQISGIFTVHSGFPWTPTGGCNKTPGNEFICPFRPVTFTGGNGNDFSNDTFTKPNGNFPGGGLKFFTLCNNGAPGSALCAPVIGRNSFRGPRYQSIDMTFGKNTPFPFFFGEQATLEVRANVFNIFNKENLVPFGFNTPSTTIDGQFFGSAEPSNGGLAGRVIEFQTRLTF